MKNIDWESGIQKREFIHNENIFPFKDIEIFPI